MDYDSIKLHTIKANTLRPCVLFDVLAHNNTSENVNYHQSFAFILPDSCSGEYMLFPSDCMPT